MLICFFDIRGVVYSELFSLIVNQTLYHEVVKRLRDSLCQCMVVGWLVIPSQQCHCSQIHLYMQVFDQKRHDPCSVLYNRPYNLRLISYPPNRKKHERKMFCLQWWGDWEKILDKCISPMDDIVKDCKIIKYKTLKTNVSVSFWYSFVITHCSFRIHNQEALGIPLDYSIILVYII